MWKLLLSKNKQNAKPCTLVSSHFIAFSDIGFVFAVMALYIFSFGWVYVCVSQSEKSDGKGEIYEIERKPYLFFQSFVLMSRLFKPRSIYVFTKMTASTFSRGSLYLATDGLMNKLTYFYSQHNNIRVMHKINTDCVQLFFKICFYERQFMKPMLFYWTKKAHNIIVSSYFITFF